METVVVVKALVMVLVLRAAGGQLMAQWDPSILAWLPGAWLTGA
jgi:hypothetical protein